MDSPSLMSFGEMLVLTPRIHGPVQLVSGGPRTKLKISTRENPGEV